mgnify:CR=1 FL=1
MQSLGHSFRALVIGSSGAIGSAFVRALQAMPNCQEVMCLSRHTQPAFALDDEASMAQAASVLQATGAFDLIVDATGVLTLDEHKPEKNLNALNAEALMRSYQLNAVGPALLIKHFVPLLRMGQRVVYAKLSARVGSISDNHKGGWYGYRAAKAGLNMLLQTAAIEAARKRPALVMAALQPGTVASALSQPFVAATDAITPDVSVAGMLQALDALPAQARAHFVDYRGQPIAW